MIHGFQNFYKPVDAKAVGRNLQDHIAVSYFYKVRTATLNDVLHPFVGKIRAGLRYMADRAGPLSLSVNQSGGFVRSDATKKHPNLQQFYIELLVQFQELRFAKMLEKGREDQPMI